MKNKSEGKIIILGAGITGLTIAWELSRFYKDRVLLLEKQDYIGGLCATLSKDNFHFDLGSHRFHDMYLPKPWKLIKILCKNKILKRKRKGMLYIREYRMPYPPSALHVVKALGYRKSAQFILSYLKAILFRCPKGSKGQQTYESHTIREVGKLAYEKFYKPYALKLWGISPDRIAMESAIRRVSRFQLSVICKDIIKMLQGKDLRFFYYPKEGMGYLPEVLKRRFLENKGTLLTSVEIEKLQMENNKITQVNFKAANGTQEVANVDTIISTIAFEDLTNLINPPLDAKYISGANLRHRSLRIFYMIIEGKSLRDNDTYYFPDPSMLVGRVSELNKFTPFLNEDSKRTLLALEIPCTYNDEIWNMDDDKLAEKCLQEIVAAGIVAKPAVEPVYFSKKLKNIYPLYEVGWKENFRKIYNQLKAIDNLYMIGRQALFLHCNIDHCMLMADKLAHFLSMTKRDRKEWEDAVASFYYFQVRD